MYETDGPGGTKVVSRSHLEQIKPNPDRCREFRTMYYRKQRHGFISNSHQNVSGLTHIIHLFKIPMCHLLPEKLSKWSDMVKH